MDDYNARALARLMAKIIPDEAGHWIWQASVRAGSYQHKYGKFWFRDGPKEAHRVAYELLVGPIPHGYEIDHVCRVTLCVNPAHLEAVTPEVNNARRALPPLIDAKNKRHAQKLEWHRQRARLRRAESPEAGPVV